MHPASLTTFILVVLLSSMTITISFKAPAEIAERIPAPGHGRSRFILQALAEKLERRPPPDWKPSTARGRRFAALLSKGKSERFPLLNQNEFSEELSARRGRSF